MLNEQRKALEKVGYEFIMDEPASKDFKSVSGSYYRVIVKSGGEIVGSRSESTQEKAMERAVELAEIHRKSPTKAAEETLTPRASGR